MATEYNWTLELKDWENELKPFLSLIKEVFTDDDMQILSITINLETEEITIKTKS